MTRVEDILELGGAVLLVSIIISTVGYLMCLCGSNYGNPTEKEEN